MDLEIPGWSDGMVELVVDQDSLLGYRLLVWGYSRKIVLDDSQRCSLVALVHGLGSRTLVVVTAGQLPGACRASDVVGAVVVANVHCTGCETASAERLFVRPGVAKAFLRLVAGLFRSTSDHCDERAARDLPCECRVVVVGVGPLLVGLPHES